ncbi:hypothetical protein ACJX0J_029030, partial [Zea mays]
MIFVIKIIINNHMCHTLIKRGMHQRRICLGQRDSAIKKIRGSKIDQYKNYKCQSDDL